MPAAELGWEWRLEDVGPLRGVIGLCHATDPEATFDEVVRNPWFREHIRPDKSVADMVSELVDEGRRPSRAGPLLEQDRSAVTAWAVENLGAP